MKHPRLICLALAAALVTMAGCGTDQAADNPTTKASNPSQSSLASANSAAPSSPSITSTPSTPTSSASTSRPAGSPSTGAKKYSTETLASIMAKSRMGGESPETESGDEAIKDVTAWSETFVVSPQQCGILLDHLHHAVTDDRVAIASWEGGTAALVATTEDRAKAYLTSRDAAIVKCRNFKLGLVEAVPTSSTAARVTIKGATDARMVTLGEGKDTLLVLTYRVGPVLVFQMLPPESRAAGLELAARLAADLAR